MGYTKHSDATTRSYLSSHASAGTDPMVHTSAIHSGTVAAACHEMLDPKKPNKAGVIIRESRDSDQHPNSRAIAVLFDQTGSMGVVPAGFLNSLTTFMGLLLKKGYVQDPHVLFGAIGDAADDHGPEVAPCQIGQFEAGNEMDSALTHIYLEGNGGGQKRESYELACWFLAKFADMDCLNKRGEKGFLFLIGDETPYPAVKKEEIERILGQRVQTDILFSSRDPRVDEVARAKSAGAEGDLLAELQEKFEVFWIMPGGGASYWNDPYVNNTLKAIFGQRFIKMENPTQVCELIAATIGVEQGYDLNSVAADLKSVGASAAAVDNATTALAHYKPSTSVATRGTVSGKLVRGKKKDAVARV